MVLANVEMFVKVGVSHDSGCSSNKWQVSRYSRRENVFWEFCSRNVYSIFYHLVGWYPISVQASNNISSANVSTSVSILDRVVLKWFNKPQGMIDAGKSSHFSFLLISGTNVTVSVSFGDATPVQKTFYAMAQNTTVNVSHM